MKKYGKKITSFLFLFVIFLSSCDYQFTPEETEMYVTIEKVNKLAFDAGIRIACQNALLDYKKRTITIDNIKHLATHNGEAWICSAKIEDNRLVIIIPNDFDYEITLSDRVRRQKHYLYKIEK